MHNSERGLLTLPVSDRDHINGPINPTVVIVEYGQYPCPRTAQAQPTIRAIQQQFADLLCFAFRHFPTPQSYPQAQRTAEAAEAAGAQGKYWQMHDLMFARQSALDNGSIVEYAVELGLDIARFLQEVTGHRHAAKIQTDQTSGRESGVIQTPSYFINNVRYIGPIDLKSLGSAVDLAIETQTDGRIDPS
jgi:protein-disulfide isomerase